MSTIEERLQMKRLPIDKWSSREQLCLASAVVRSGDQNWMSVSRALKPFAEQNRPPDWFSQKNCAAQYNLLLETVETPKRKKRLSGNEVAPIVTPGEIIVQNLTQKRKEELGVIIAKEKAQLLKLQEEMDLIRNGKATEEQIEAWAEEEAMYEKQKEQDAIEYTNWLKTREQRKLEMERVFRPGAAFIPKNKSIDEEPTIKQEPEEIIVHEGTKPVLSPLLTSLLKTPTQTSPSILHSSMSSQSAPTIASLLNTSASVPVSPGIQQLVSIAISQEPNTAAAASKEKEPSPEPEPIKIEMKEEEPKEEIKKPEDDEKDMKKMEESESPKEIENQVEETDIQEKPDDKISEQDEEVVSEIQDEDSLENSEIKEEKSSPQPTQDEEEEEEDEDDEEEEQDDDDDDNEKEETKKEKEKDVYDFDNEKSTESSEQDKEDSNSSESIIVKLNEKVPVVKAEQLPDKPEKKKEERTIEGNVEIIEYIGDEIVSELPNMMSYVIHNSVQDKSSKPEISQEIKQEIKKETTVYDEYDFDEKKSEDMKSNIDTDATEPSVQKTFTEFTEESFDGMQIEVTKLDKSGKAKRDYSRKKIKEEKDTDILSAIEKAVHSSIEENEIIEETGSDSDKKSDKITKLKQEERSNSPWTEEDEIPFGMRTRRRYSTPATPVDSVPNSPASSNFDIDDREYRTWKKSVMLVYNRLATHKFASLFLKPITDDQAPGYHDVVYRPMDLQTIRKNIENGTIRTTTDFQRDVLLMFNNAIMFNKTNSLVYNMAHQMQKEGLEQIQILLQAQMSAETPIRRETRTSESGLKRKRLQDEFPTRSKKRRDE